VPLTGFSRPGSNSTTGRPKLSTLSSPTKPSGRPDPSRGGVKGLDPELTETAVVQPYVDFSSLDVVGVITGRHGGGTVAAGSPR
jgi:hypothetical protein